MTWGWGLQATGLVTRVAPAFRGQTFTEGYLSQPHLMGDATLLGGRVTLAGTINLEGLTLRRGELNPGMYGEGYADRRHPHAYVHDLVASVSWRVRGLPGARASLAAGRGFTPFGTDDPMDRPFAKFPVNHHQAQVMERLLAVAAVRWGPALLEAGTFNGDEPMAPGRAPQLRRFGDSWAVRATALPLAGLELAASHARVASPEGPPGRSYDHVKWSASTRWASSSDRGREYALAEWAVTHENLGRRRAFRFTSLLAEALAERRGVAVAVRAERTTRPEEDRLLDPFRAPRPPLDLTILGITRWDIGTIAVSAPGLARRLADLGVAGGPEPFVEVAGLRAKQVLRPAVFQPLLFYGAERMRTVSIGLRVHLGSAHARMGQYGVARRPEATHDAHTTHP